MRPSGKLPHLDTRMQPTYLDVLMSTRHSVDDFQAPNDAGSVESMTSTGEKEHAGGLDFTAIEARDLARSIEASFSDASSLSDTVSERESQDLKQAITASLVDAELVFEAQKVYDFTDVRISELGGESVDHGAGDN